jgi:hypothetical protein
MTDLDYESLTRHLAEQIGRGPVESLSKNRSLNEVEEMAAEAWAIVDDLGTDGKRGEAAERLIERLVPAFIDVKLWQAIALGENVHLPASDQYGPVSERIKPSDPKVRNPAKGNVYGRVHDKGQQAPSDFMERQGKAVASAAAKIVRLEQELEEAREHRLELEAGLKSYATTCLLTAMRRATAPLFAMGPAWTLLRAISGRTGQEVSEKDSAIETHRILVILHALREHEGFERELKQAIHAVCVRFDGEARRRGKTFTEFDGPYDYESIIESLEWPNEGDRTDGF